MPTLFNTGIETPKNDRLLQLQPDVLGLSQIRWWHSGGHFSPSCGVVLLYSEASGNPMLSERAFFYYYLRMSFREDTHRESPVKNEEHFNSTMEKETLCEQLWAKWALATPRASMWSGNKVFVKTLENRFEIHSGFFIMQNLSQTRVLAWTVTLMVRGLQISAAWLRHWQQIVRAESR